MTVIGRFEGGELVLPGVKRTSDGKALCFRYLPGDIILMRSKEIEHCVRPWHRPDENSGEFIIHLLGPIKY